MEIERKYLIHTLPTNIESYEHLRTKVDGHIITKKRYMIPPMLASLADTPLTMHNILLQIPQSTTPH